MQISAIVTCRHSRTSFTISGASLIASLQTHVLFVEGCASNLKTLLISEYYIQRQRLKDVALAGSHTSPWLNQKCSQRFCVRPFSMNLLNIWLYAKVCVSISVSILETDGCFYAACITSSAPLPALCVNPPRSHSAPLSMTHVFACSD